MVTKYELPHMGGSTFSTKLAARLLMEMRDGEYKEATRLPSEIELAEHFGVSRSVIRDVLSSLEREGFVERGRGIGTVIHRDTLNLANRLDLKYEYNELVRSVGAQPSSDEVRVYEKEADATLASRLEVEEGSGILVVEKRILASGKPVIYSIDHLPKSLFEHLDYRMLDWAIPVFDILEDKCGIVVDTDIANICATVGDETVRKKLQLGQDEAVLHIDEVGYYKLSRPILQSYGYYRNVFNFTMLRKKF